jgi:hypothetical protein
LARGCRVNRLVTPPLKADLKVLATTQPWLYLDEFQHKLHQGTGVRLSFSTIFKVLTLELKWSLRVQQAKAKERNDNDRAAHHLMMRQVTRDPAQFIFIDETAKDRNASRRGRMWGPRGRNFNITRHFSDRYEFRYTMIGAVDINGFVPEVCEIIKRKRNAEVRDPEAGTVDSERFEYWIEHTLCPHLGNYWQSEPRSIVVMDNASTHCNGRTRALIQARGAILIFLPAYSPDLNPIEFCFHQYKSHLKRHHSRYGFNPYIAHHRALGAVSRVNMLNYYRKVGGINGLPEEEEEVNAQEQQYLVVIAQVAAFMQVAQTLLL